MFAAPEGAGSLAGRAQADMNKNILGRTTFARDAYAVIRSMLLDEARFAPGEKISVESLSRDLAVSRSPVWAAISRLEAEGLLHVVPRQGVFAIAFNEKKVIEIFEARETLETAAARLAAARMTDEHHAVMSRALTHQAHAIETRDLAAYRASNLDFHHGLLAAAKNAVIEAMLKSLYAQTQAMCNGRIAPASGWDRLRQNVSEHRQTLDRLALHDEDGAEQAARQHVRQLLKTILARDN
jgi:DNA-binding GntR family transcriptional regulator